ncbi:MAG: tetratricopeptide repeat protein, partial [Bacteroidota bacterium]
RALLNDVNTYPLERENSRLWREYYKARIMHIEGNTESAYQLYSQLMAGITNPKLRAYIMADYGEALRQLQKHGEAIPYLEKAISIVPIDAKLTWAFHQLSEAYERLNRHSDAWAIAEKLRDYCVKNGNQYGLLVALDRLQVLYSDQGNFREAEKIRQQRLEILTSMQFSFPYMEMFVLGGLGFYRAMLSGRCRETEQDLIRAMQIGEELNAANLVYILRDLGYVYGMEGKYLEAEKYLMKSLELSRQLGSIVYDIDQAIANGFLGAIQKRQGRLEEAEEKLVHSLERRKIDDVMGLPELYIWLGELAEMRSALDGQSSQEKLAQAGSHYTNAVSVVHSLQIRHNFGVWALTGLIRVKHAQGDYAAIPPLLAEAEQLAQQYEYNDHLASLRLTQGHLALTPVPSPTGRGEGDGGWGEDFDAALRYYQQALIYALRYNRFLLDEALSGRPQGTPLRPIIPECLKRGEEGRKMLVALRDWWQTGINDIGTPRPDTISPIPEGIPLLEAERIAREREPGDGSPQKSVVEQIEKALQEMGAG